MRWWPHRHRLLSGIRKLTLIGDGPFRRERVTCLRESDAALGQWLPGDDELKQTHEVTGRLADNGLSSGVGGYPPHRHLLLAQRAAGEAAIATAKTGVAAPMLLLLGEQHRQS